MKLTQTKDYLLLIDEGAEIKENTWYENKGVLFLSDCKYDKGNNPNNSNPRVTNFNNSAIAYYPLNSKAKELDLPLLPNPFEKDNIVNEVERIFNEGDINHELYNEKEICNAYKAGIYDGYKAASKQFTLEDMKKAIEMATEMLPNLREEDGYYLKHSAEEIIQSLSAQQLPEEFSLGKGNTIEERIKNGHYE